MKIAFFDVTVTNSIGGIQTVVWELSQEFAKRGNDDLYLSISIGAGNIKRIKDAIILQEAVGNFKDYYYRKRRLEAGDRQIEGIFGTESYYRFLKDSRDMKSKRERKRALPNLLRVYERLLFPIDVILKIINSIVRRQLNNSGVIFTDGWETQKSAKL